MIKRIIVSMFFLLSTVVLFPSISTTVESNPIEIVYEARLPEVVVTAKFLNYKKITTIILEDIISKESRGNPKAIGDTHLKDYALGIVQIRMCCIKDVNKTYGTKFSSKDRLDVEKSIEIYHLYLEKGITLYLKKYNRMPTHIEIKAMWNGGIYKGYKNKQALAYARR